jgi:hypothetical protein
MSDFLRLAVRSDILQLTPDGCATKWVFEAAPFIFKNFEPAVFWQWKSELAKGLDVDPKNLLITGSASVGISLNPSKSMKDFDLQSDIDVAVISTYHFDSAWRALRSLGTQRFKLTQAQQYALESHIKKYIYWGTIATDRILPILPFAGEWLGAFSEMAAVSPTIDRKINARIYRDFASLRAYMNLTFRNLRDSILESGSTGSERIPEEEKR